MKKHFQLFLICSLTLVSFSGCDMLNMPNKMDDLKSSTDDHMNKVEATTQQVDDDTKDGLRLNKIGVALQNILLDQNTEYFLPVPADMMPWAQVLADNLHEDEFMKLMDVWARRITQVAASCSDVTGAVITPDGKCTLPPDVAAKTDHEKQAKFWAIAAVSGLMSQSMIDQTVQTEYTDGGQFNETLYEVMAARQIFIQTVLMDNTLMEKDVDDPGKIAKAVEYAEDLQYIADLPFSPQIDFNMSAMFVPVDVVDVAFDPTIAPTEWAKINSAFTTQLKPQYKIEMEDSKSVEGLKLLSEKYEVLSHLTQQPKTGAAK
jgi:hypothetical protein